jgi:hypothetical protein
MRIADRLQFAGIIEGQSKYHFLIFIFLSRVFTLIAGIFTGRTKTTRPLNELPHVNPVIMVSYDKP